MKTRGTMRRRATLCGALALLLANGCARNAVFELELELPPAPAGDALYAVVFARSGVGFEAGFEDVEPTAVALAATCARPDPAPVCADRELDDTCSAVVSVVADDSDVAAPLFVAVRFCSDPRCEGAADPPEHRVEIERAFYVGRYTQARVCIDEVPAEPPEIETIARCDVRCREGSTSSHCRLDGTHFCE